MLESVEEMDLSSGLFGKKLLVFLKNRSRVKMSLRWKVAWM